MVAVPVLDLEWPVQPLEPVWFIEENLYHTIGPWAGHKFKLRDWQREWIWDLFAEVDCPYCDGRPGCGYGRRRYSRGILGIPKGNGKSPLGSALGIHGLVGDGRVGGEVYAVAGDKYQARIVFDTARTMVENAPELADVLKPYRDAIEDPETGSVFRVLSADAPLKHGLRPTRIIFDEVHVQPSRELWDTLEPGLVKQHNTLMVGITTAGYDPESLLGDLCKEGESGKDSRYLYRWYGLPEDSKLKHTDETAWEIANPALDDFLPREGLRDMVQRLPENVFRRLHLNQWTPADTTWITGTQWDSCRGRVQWPRPKTPIWVAIDAGMKHDSTGLVMVWKSKDRLDTAFQMWDPADIEDEVLDLTVVAGRLRELAKEFEIVECAYDPYFFGVLAPGLLDEGINMVEFQQNNELMCPASQTLFEAVVNKRLRHNGDPKARRHALAAVAKETERGWRISKAASKQHIDLLVALAMAVQRASLTEEAGPAVVKVQGTPTEPESRKAKPGERSTKVEPIDLMGGRRRK